jgi:hypothetical protein
VTAERGGSNAPDLDGLIRKPDEAGHAQQRVVFAYLAPPRREQPLSGLGFAHRASKSPLALADKVGVGYLELELPLPAARGELP